MTSKSPDTPTSDVESSAPAERVGAGESGQAGTGQAGSGQAETLTQLRSAISEIDQRHAEGEAGFFAGLSDIDADPAPRKSSRKSSQKSSQTSPRTKKRTAGRKRQQSDPDSGWVEGGTEALPDFVDAPDFAQAPGFAQAPDFVDGADDDGPPDFAAGPGLSFDDEDDAPDFDADYAHAKKTAMNMLAMRDHSSDELRKKLLKRDLMPEAVDVLIEKLQNSKLLNDEEFAHRFVRAQRENRKLSRSVLKRELSKKGISPELAADAVAEVDGEEELAREVAAKKAASTRRLEHHVRERRILGMLARRGFPSGICIKVTREVLAED
ncbi:regulatory protein RecX [Brevibacterium spongiae]|uniref:Regulatory protein RecX n=1 Tax=Brevibacterium spongiae TaxID=2909672 RepID=A0ABY5SP45_9MICO|nr:regulatory protein RecX [Brevibacterium spongiae]UVI34806.1 recombination regulator RecX [Brevibacterium spongiae]